jgi:carbon storage regulator
MLILTRKTGEVITIGEDVTVKVISVQDGQVKLGIEAPRELSILRAELYKQIQQHNVNATKTPKSFVARAAGLLAVTPPEGREPKSSRVRRP